jgi:hypothetical protein
MLLEKDKIREIIRHHKISSFKDKDEEELINIFYESFSEIAYAQEEKLATKEDIKNILERMDERFEAVDKRFEDMYKYMDQRFEAVDKRFEAVDKRFEAVDKRFEDMNKKFTMMFTFMNIGFGIIILLTILFKFLH